MTDFRPTFIWWHNCLELSGQLDSSGEHTDVSWSKKLSHVRRRGDDRPFFESLRYGSSTQPRDCFKRPCDGHRMCEDEPNQLGLALSKTAGAFALDADTVEFEDGEVHRVLQAMGAQPITVRSDDATHRHYLVDARAFKHRWPTQGRILGGDVKSNGFVAAPGSTHYTGNLYQPVGEGLENLVTCTDELLDAIEADRQERTRRHVASGGGLGDGQDDELARYAYKLACHDSTETEAYEAWRALADTFTLHGRPWERHDFDRHWRGAVQAASRRDDVLPSWQLELAQSWARQGVTEVPEAAAQPAEPALPGNLAPLDQVIADRNEYLRLNYQEGWAVAPLRSDRPTDAFRKMSAEHHFHFRSRDWQTAAPHCLNLFDLVLKRHALGRHMTVDEFIARDEYVNSQGATVHGEAATWLCAPEHGLIGVVGDQVYALDDREFDLDLLDDEVKKVQHLFPGTPARTLDEARTGRSFVKRYHPVLNAAVAELVAAHGGHVEDGDVEGLKQLKRLSQRQVAAYLNDPETRERYPELQELRACGVNQAREALNRLKNADAHAQECEHCADSGLVDLAIRVEKEPEYWRAEHGWCGMSSAYVFGRNENLLPAPAREHVDADGVPYLTRFEVFEGALTMELWTARTATYTPAPEPTRMDAFTEDSLRERGFAAVN